MYKIGSKFCIYICKILVANCLSRIYNNNIILSKGTLLIRTLCIMFRKEYMYNRIWFHEYQEMGVLYRHHDTIVYLAQHVKLLNLCVIKQINKGSTYFDQGLMEARILKSLQHNGIPLLYDHYETEDAIFLVEEYKEGETLYSICQSEQLSYQSILSFGIQLCNILYYLHSLSPSVLHLDINPNNIIVHEGQLSLIDFSAAIQLETKKYYGQRYGTPGYAAPEQFSIKPLDCRTDMYAFGKTLATMLSRLDQRMVTKKIVYGIEKIVRTCTRYKKLQRYHSIQQVGSLLSKLYQEEKSNEPKEELSYVVAGTQNRIGTTHMALLLSTYLKSVHGSCLYVERNLTKNASFLIREQKLLGETGFYEYEHIPIMPFADKEEDSQSMRHQFSCSVADLGVLTKDNIHEFMQYRNRIIVFGSKAHELSMTITCLKLLPSLTGTYFLENFVSYREDKIISQLMPDRQRFHFPYEPNLAFQNDSEIYSLFSKMEKGVW